MAQPEQNSALPLVSAPIEDEATRLVYSKELLQTRGVSLDWPRVSVVSFARPDEKPALFQTLQIVARELAQPDNLAQRVYLSSAVANATEAWGLLQLTDAFVLLLSGTSIGSWLSDWSDTFGASEKLHMLDILQHTQHFFDPDSLDTDATLLNGEALPIALNLVRYLAITLASEKISMAQIIHSYNYRRGAPFGARILGLLDLSLTDLFR